MCGIYGTIGKDFKTIEKLFSTELAHRGPDDKGIFYDDSKELTLGHSRLSIIDLSSQGHQPMSDDSGNYTLVYNGEIYNYRDIRKTLQKLGYKFTTQSDSEVIINSYKEWGEECLKQFRGMFAFCMYDKVKNHLFLARDRFGIKPLIYTFLDSQFIFSSELKPFLNSTIIPKKLDHVSLSEYFTYGAVSQPGTMLKGVSQLMPGHFMTVDFDRGFKIYQYYDLINESGKLDPIDCYEEAVKVTRKTLEEATKYHLVADVEVGAFLSGGVDSTAVVALMQEYSEKQINTFSVGFQYKTNVIDETDVATRTAKLLGTNHHNIMVTDSYITDIFDGFIDSLDQPSIDGINTYIVSMETAKQMKVALSGLGGDEIFAGYLHFKFLSKILTYKPTLISQIGKRLNRIRSNRFTRSFEYYGLGEETGLDKQRSIHSNLAEILQNPQHTKPIKLYPELTSIQRISKSEIENYMLNTLLRDNDIFSMAHSLEVRPILLDHKLMELVFSFRDEFKLRNGKLKAVFIDSIKDKIPAEVWKRKKSGFDMPLDSWMNGVLKENFQRVAQKQHATQIFEKKFLTSLHKKIKYSKLKKSDWISFIFLNWMERYNIVP